jgi:hypothetical protein
MTKNATPNSTEDVLPVVPTKDDRQYNHELTNFIKRQNY